MTAFVFANYVDTTLAAAASSTATSLSLSSSANLPVLGPGDVMPLTLNDAATGLVYEIVYVTGISGTTLTVLRAQEGTSAQNWSSGDYAFTGPTAETVAPVAGTHSPVASETLPAANQLVVTPGTLTAGIDLTLNDAAAAGSGVTIYGSAADYAVTVQSPVTTGSPYIELPDGSQVYSWAIPAASPSQGIRVDWDGTNWRARTFGQTVVAPATQNNAAVPYGQAFQFLTPTASETITLGNTLKTEVMPNITAAATFTLEPGSVAGQSVIFYGNGNYGVTVQSNVTTGYPYFALPNNSNIYSWAIPTSSQQCIELVWDGTNWRARTFGQTVVAPATQNNAAVQLGQVAGVQSGSTLSTISNATGGTAYTTTMSFTAPVAGALLINANISTNGNGSTGNATIDVNSTQVYSGGWGLNQFNGISEAISVSAGGTTITLTYTPGNTISGNTYNNLAYIFVPTP